MRIGRGGGLAAPRPGAGAGCAGAAARPAARGDRARLLRRLHPVGARRATRTTARHDQEPYVLGPDAPARAPRRRDREDGDGRTRPDRGLRARRARPGRARALRGAPRLVRDAAARSCRSSGRSQARSARAAGGPTPPASLRERILEQARDERPNVVPLRRRVAAPVLASAAAVAAVVAVALGIWSLVSPATSTHANSVVAVLSDPNASVHRHGGRRGEPRRHPDRPRRARRPHARPGAGGQGLRDLGHRGRRPAAGRPVRAAGRDDAVAEGRARARRSRSRSSPTAASTRPRATRSSRPSRRNEPVTKP